MNEGQWQILAILPAVDADLQYPLQWVWACGVQQQSCIHHLAEKYEKSVVTACTTHNYCKHITISAENFVIEFQTLSFDFSSSVPLCPFVTVDCKWQPFPREALLLHYRWSGKLFCCRLCSKMESQMSLR